MLFKKLCTKIKNFIYAEKGSELMQWAIIIIIVAGMAVVAYAMSDALTSKVSDANDALQDIG